VASRTGRLPGDGADPVRELWDGENALRPGIAAVNARREDGRLRVVAGTCRNLLAEAELYRYGDDRTERAAEAPVDEHNHALAALRYLVAGMDAGRLLRRRNPAGDGTDPSPAEAEKRRQ
jgi:hypothetical protein